MEMPNRDLASILRCPRCSSPLANVEEADLTGAGQPIYCSDPGCRYAEIGFPIACNQPILIDFENSIINEEKFFANNARSPISRGDSAMGLKSRIRRFIAGRNRIAEIYCTRFIETIKSQSTQPRVLVVGGGEVGSGASLLYSEPSIHLVGTDVYASPYTLMVADGHHLPFCDNSFDGVWIQAVLEHVLDPNIVVSEIHRVLKFNGVVYADTPFMQQVHEGALDFTRFTLSGHRWLFRKFHHESSGAVSGAGTALIWSIRYFVRALTGSDRIAWSVSLAAFWLRYFDRFAKKRPNADAACGVFFFGKKARDEISPKSMIAFYEQQTR
jgi:SAM-dependent methyltransferase